MAPVLSEDEEDDAASAIWTLVSPKQVRSLIIYLSRAFRRTPPAQRDAMRRSVFQAVG